MYAPNEMRTQDHNVQDVEGNMRLNTHCQLLLAICMRVEETNCDSPA
jgi:hypothetical protein